MWLQHLSDVSTRRKEGAKKAAATRQQKNKGHAEGNTKESSGTFILKGLRNNSGSVYMFLAKMILIFVGNDMFCFCGQGEYGEMIACDSPTCPVEWFQLDCLGLSCAPEGEWICPLCIGLYAQVMILTKMSF